VKRPILIASAAAVYLTAAWMVAPGFYDGFTPPQPYAWTSPPPQAVLGNVAPRTGHGVINVIGGVSDAGSVFTDDGCPLTCSPQVVIGFLPGAFDAAGKTSVTVDIKPESTFSPPTGLHFSTNAYLISASAPLNPAKAANLELRYSDLVPAPSFVYLASDANSPWKSIGGSESQQFILQTTTMQLGYFAAGYAGNATNAPSSTNQLLPIAVAVLILGVLVAGVPLAIVRRRRAGDADEPDDDDEDPGGSTRST
jgi:hypothetical protein